MKENNIPESFENAMNDLVVGRVVPLNTALNEPYKELDNIDSLKLHNHVLAVANDELDEENKHLKEDIELYKKVNIDLRKELTMYEKLIESNTTYTKTLSSVDWKELHDMQQKLVISLELEKIKLEKEKESVFKSFETFKDRYYKQREIVQKHKQLNDVAYLWKVELEKAKEQIEMLEKLIELNMKDLWDIADQRDWYYEEYQKLKNRLTD
jgi:hypothetical protein